jgi:hypothetical protein
MLSPSVSPLSQQNFPFIKHSGLFCTTKQPPSESGDLQKLLDKTYKQVKKSKVWSEPNKQDKLKSLLAELQGLLSAED